MDMLLSATVCVPKVAVAALKTFMEVELGSGPSGELGESGPQPELIREVSLCKPRPSILASSDPVLWLLLFEGELWRPDIASGELLLFMAKSVFWRWKSFMLFAVRTVLRRRCICFCFGTGVL